MKSKNFFSAPALNSLSSQVAILDEEGKIIQINQSWSRFGERHGQGRHRASLGENYFVFCREDLKDGELVARALDGMRTVLSGERETFQLEYPCDTDERQFWFSMRVNSFQSGGQTYLVVSHEDITGRREVDEALRLLMARHEALLNNIPDIVWMKDLDSRYIAVNEPFAQSCGKSRHEVVGITDLDIWPTWLADKYRMDDRRVLENGISLTFEEHLQTPDGMLKWVETMKTPIRDAEGNMVGTVGIARDITSRKGAEDLLLASHERLEAMVRSRTAELEKLNETLIVEIAERRQAERELQRARNELEMIVQIRTDALRQLNSQLSHELRERKALEKQLIHAQKMESLGELAAGVAHEINNPLAFIVSNLTTLGRYLGALRTVLEQYECLALCPELQGLPEFQAQVEQIALLRKSKDIDFILSDLDVLVSQSLEGGQRVQEIVQGLKVFARMDEAELIAADINGLLEQALKLTRNELKYCCQIHRDLSPLPELPCYPGQLSQVFINILVNAAQAIGMQSAPGMGEVRIESRMEEDSIVVVISDNGPGIPADVLQKVFEPFYTTKPVGTGTGLGLSISYGIVEKHGGTIDVQSEEGRGTTFTIRLPLRWSGQEVPQELQIIESINDGDFELWPAQQQAS